MAIVIFVMSLMIFVSQIQAQYNWAIPCHTVAQCESVLGTSQGLEKFKCTQGFCLCANMTTNMFQLCSNKDMILTAKASGLRRNCTNHEDCNVVEGANCLPKDPKDKSVKICLCQLDKVESEDGQSCLPVVAEIGGKCKENLQCISRLGDGAECFEEQCRCKSTHHSLNSKCVRNLGFGDHCEIKEDGCYQMDVSKRENLLTCTENYGCRCKKQWTYNQETQHCEFSNASQTAAHFLTMSAFILLIAFF